MARVRLTTLLISAFFRAVSFFCLMSGVLLNEFVLREFMRETDAGTGKKIKK